METTAYRVAEHTSDEVNRRIQERTRDGIALYKNATPEQLDRRLQELDEEWDIERALEANGSTLLLIGMALGTFVNRKWLVLPAAVGTFCLQHALQGWCPPIEAFRRMGIRTAREIEAERVALKALRGDFSNVSGTSEPATPDALLSAARR